MLLNVAQNKLTIKLGNKVAPSVRDQNKHIQDCSYYSGLFNNFFITYKNRKQNRFNSRELINGEF